MRCATELDSMHVCLHPVFLFYGSLMVYPFLEYGYQKKKKKIYIIPATSG
jgi:hypothetical protein